MPSVSESIRLVRVVAVSPGDVTKERKRLVEVVEELNRGTALRLGCQLRLWRWETDAHPGLHLEGPQGLIDDAMAIEDADLVVGIFWKRFGTPTFEEGSGTAYELRRAWSAWGEQGRPQVMLYFCERPFLPKDLSEHNQYGQLLSFKAVVPPQQLVVTYKPVSEFEQSARESLGAFLFDLVQQPVPAAPSPPEPPPVPSGPGGGVIYTPPSAVESLVLRRETRALSAAELVGLRDGFKALQSLSDQRGYQYLAGINGLPLPMYGLHTTPQFLAWNRAYLYHFERALRDRVPGTALTWWDWTRSHADGIPDAFARRRTPGGHRNPLFDAAIQPEGREADSPPRTVRARGPAGFRLPSADDVERVLERVTFLDFSSQLIDLHAQVHVWVGGTMGRVSTGAYDPLFWAHRAMVDRLWHEWQQRHPSVELPDSLTGKNLPPFPLRFADVLDPNQLGYDYAV